MNIVERKRRLNAEAMATAGSDNVLGSQAVLNDEDTDDVDSEEADIFTRRDKFDKLLTKFKKHNQATSNTLKGNDLRYNVYLKKLEKMTRTDLGLDLAAYKDYVNNLKEFARINTDMGIYAHDSLNNEIDFNADNRVMLQAEMDFENKDLDPVKEEQIVNSINFTLRKLLRTHSGYLNKRDEVAAECLIKDMKKHVL